jgi:hypothetical protein
VYVFHVVDGSRSTDQSCHIRNRLGGTVRDTLKYGVDSAYARDIMMSIASLSSTVVTVVLLWDVKKNRIVNWFEIGLVTWK